MSSDPSTWAPNEPADALWNERSYMAGILIGAVAYGVHATLFFITLQLLWARKRSSWRDWNWIAYILVLFILSSIANGTQFKFTQQIWIDMRNYPGGPSAVIIEQQTQMAAVWCVGAYIVNNWLQDGLIVYRFSVFYGRRSPFLIVPAILFLANVAVSLAFIVSMSHESFFGEAGVHLLTSYFSISVGLNVICTAAIVGKLWNMHRRLRRVGGGTGKHFTAAAMLIESAFLYSAVGIMFLIPWGLEDPVQNLFLPTLGQVESIAPLLIIMRVAQGEAWTVKTATQFEMSLMGGRGGQTGIETVDSAVERGLSKTTSGTNMDAELPTKDFN
ncbi:hypothetical protein EXIGLDRAFT_751066 [Exidia glandulosa HHB12029]|uniref:Uncharacterized protein n=1 Tax=Exidia glandulosa HHB12029 TaxID=1314781 RepID=A0A165FVM3_EXIGL|nr:hypothetical protein EXIGLDRAFT_751066 [Exidia glandulosa HHB12029]